MLKIADFKSKFLENCHKYEKVSARKVSELRILCSLQKCLFEISATKKLEIANFEKI